MHCEVCTGATAVRYASVDPESRSPEIHGRGTDCESRSGYTDRAARFLSPDLAFQAAGR